ncbi:hypothetical protein B0H67DRAFT_480949 [Lasiosphaeris hirsuta]|uniref:Uncharacterized protein n=1 Tax=Lasiosphaeris hirsuta TaxID=260670 RepID=A0AA40B045_9PEZI|nr:hypothetical protein B0H67DRAFT_480949 [Lasiosphaeris hirsuta]
MNSRGVPYRTCRACRVRQRAAPVLDVPGGGRVTRGCNRRAEAEVAALNIFPQDGAAPFRLDYRPLNLGEPKGWIPTNGVESVSEHDVGPMTVECEKCGALHWLDERLARSSAANPKFGKCCSGGKVDLQPWRELPAFLTALLKGEAPNSTTFRKNIRRYNNAFQFTSVKCT